MLPNILRSKCNQTINEISSVNRIQYEKHFFFWKNHTQNVVEKPLLGTLLKDQT